MALDANGVPIRRGIARQLTFDHDAWELLQQMSPTRKGYGRYVSELIRRDYLWRQEWQRLRAVEQEMLVEVGACDD